MLQNPCKTFGFNKNMVYKISPVGEVNHIQPVAYIQIIMKTLKCDIPRHSTISQLLLIIDT